MHPLFLMLGLVSVAFTALMGGVEAAEAADEPSTCALIAPQELADEA